MYCGKCGNKVPDGAKFCNLCGHQLPERKVKPVAPPEIVPEEPICQPVEQNEAPVYAPYYDSQNEYVAESVEEPAYQPADEYYEAPEAEPIQQEKPAKQKKQKQQKPKKKGKAGVVVAIILVLALAAGAVWWFFLGGKDMIGKNQIEISEEVLDEIIELDDYEDFDDPVKVTYAKVTDTEEYELLGIDCKDEYITVKGENKYVTFETGYIAAYYDEDGEWVLDKVRRNDEYESTVAPKQNISEEDVKLLVRKYLDNDDLRFDDISIDKFDEDERKTEAELTVTGEIDGEYITADAEASFGLTPDGWYIWNVKITDKREADEPEETDEPDVIESDIPIPIETDKVGDETDIAIAETEATEPEHLTFELVAGEPGKYGKIITYNKGTEYEESFYAYYVPYGTYAVTNVGDYKTQVNVYGDEVNISDSGYEEHILGMVKLVDIGETVTITVWNDQHIEIVEPTHLEMMLIEEYSPETEVPETEVPETEAHETEAPQTTPPETEAPQTTPPETEAPQTTPPETEAPVVSDPKATLRVPAGYEVAVFTHDSATGKTIIIAKNTSDKLYYILDTNGNRLINTGYDSYSNIAAPYFGNGRKIYKYNFSKNVMEDVAREVYERLMANTPSDIYYNKEMDLLVTVNEEWKDEWDKYNILDARYNEQYWEMQISLLDSYPRVGTYETREALKNNGNPYDMIGHTPVVVKRCSFSTSSMRLVDNFKVQMVIDNFSTTNKYGVVGTNIPFDYDELYAYAPEWSPIWYVAKMGSVWGVIDGNNVQVIKFKYGDIMVFANPDGYGFKLYAVVSKIANGKKVWGVVDEDGNTVVPFEYEQIVPINFTTELKQYGCLGVANEGYTNENLEFYVKKNGSWSAISAR